MLTTIRNALLVSKFDIAVPYSKLKWHILQVFKDLRLIDRVQRDEKENKITFSIVIEEDKPVFSELRRLSKPGRRHYVGWKEIPHPVGNGVVIISTSQGVMTGRMARQRHLGGELICELA